MREDYSLKAIERTTLPFKRTLHVYALSVLLCVVVYCTCVVGVCPATGIVVASPASPRSPLSPTAVHVEEYAPLRYVTTSSHALAALEKSPMQIRKAPQPSCTYPSAAGCRRIIPAKNRTLLYGGEFSFDSFTYHHSCIVSTQYSIHNLRVGDRESAGPVGCEQLLSEDSTIPCSTFT